MIYFIQDQNLHHIKIGYTGDDPVGRLKALQTGSAAKLVLLGCVEGSQSEEAEMHRRFAEHRVAGEWFRPAPEILQYMLACAGHTNSPAVTARPKWPEPLRLYLAGKIERNCWRHGIVRGLGDRSVGLKEWSVYWNSILECHHYVGPFFESAFGHGSSHGDDTHGQRGISSLGCDKFSYGSSELVDREKVHQHCLKAIQKANCLFAWIDQPDCYGTVTEIGYAKAIGKMVWVAGPRRFRDLWFVYETAEVAIQRPNAIQALSNIIDNWMMKKGEVPDLQRQL